jgi:solute carrier family 30 (zinc transporter), member 1
VSEYLSGGCSAVLRATGYLSHSVVGLTVVISQPLLVLVVGSAGLVSNIVGLALFHDHGHGGHAHEAGHENVRADVETGEHVNEVELEGEISPSEDVFDEAGPIEDVLPATIVRRASSVSKPRPRIERLGLGKGQRKRRRSFATADDILVSPAANRQYILSQMKTGLLEETDSGEDGYNGDTTMTLPYSRRRSGSIPHDQHNHARSRKGESKHSHENLNMKGVFLHVLGDALGNIGVIATALFIWQTDYSWRFYSDPVISLVITAIIFWNAMPLVKSASLILLQGVPRGISLDDVKEDILQVPTAESFR